MKVDFSSRSDELEIMDDLDCKGEVVNQTLRELDNINKWLGGNKISLSGLKSFSNGKSNAFHIADLGCGGGDIIQWLSKKKSFADFRFTGIDANKNIIAYAEQKNGYSPSVRFQCIDVTSDLFHPSEYDILHCSLFLHHFNSETLSELLKTWTKKVKRGIVINDLQRHPLAYYSIKLLTKLFSRSAMVKYDAPLSVLRGFSRKEWQQILFNAGVTNYTIRWRWAFRWEIVIFA